MPSQSGWRFCIKCGVMQFSLGANMPGRCAAGDGDHQPQGFNFHLPFNRPRGEKDENNFFFCRQCHALFFMHDFAGGELGTCPIGGQHDRTNSINFVLPHDRPVNPPAQDRWVVCVNCNALHFGPAGDKPCAKPGTLGHNPGANPPIFILPHGPDSDFIP